MCTGKISLDAAREPSRSRQAYQSSSKSPHDDGRDAGLVYPPVSSAQFSLGEVEDFYLLVGGFVPYKRESVVLEAVLVLTVAGL